MPFSIVQEVSHGVTFLECWREIEFLKQHINQSYMADGGFDPNDKLPSADDVQLPVDINGAIVPLTCKQMAAIPSTKGDDIDIVIDNQVRKQGSVIGRVVSITTGNISNIYELEQDGYRVQIKQYVTTDSLEQCAVGTYVYAVGRLVRDETKMDAFAVKPVTDFNQIAFHNMQALFVHLFALRGLPPGSQYAGRETTTTAPHPTAAKVDAKELLYKAITELVKGQSEKDSAGVLKREIVAQMGQLGHSVEDVGNALEYLSVQGAIFEQGEGLYSTW